MAYMIPFKKRPVIIGQGFHGLSHKNWKAEREDFSYSIDFILPKRTKVIASRAGTVAKVKTGGSRNYGGKNPVKGELAYKEWMNEIEIRHSDRTYASYAHLDHNGSFVEVGDSVERGQVIGLSGNTGWSSQPHLDFSVFKKHVNGYNVRTIKIRFEDFDAELEDCNVKAADKSIDKYRFRPPNPNSWSLFLKEKRKITAKLGRNAIIEHVGSTAVEKLGGKGIIDIVVAVPKTSIQKAKALLKNAGYTFSPDSGDKHRLFFWGDYIENGKVRRVHLHLTHHNSKDFIEMVAVTDYLRSNRQEAQRYEAVKRKAARIAHGSGKKYKSLKKKYLDTLTKKAIKNAASAS